MIQISFSIAHPSQQYIGISIAFPTPDDVAIIQLPSWRPGRYELGDFAKNVKNFVVFNEKNERLDCRKTTKDQWTVDTSKSKEVIVKYLYYANVLNAGSTFLDANQLYVNPVNCCAYVPNLYDVEVQLNLDIPSNWRVATSLLKTDQGYSAKNVDELMDSPFIASSQLQHRVYDSYGTKFNVWFNGEVKPDWDRLLADFKAFTDAQIAKFTEFPVKEYHFLNQILPYAAYHGVEHQRSTVIALGPSYEVFKDQYKELLGVSSHELYHTWNVKAIRPIEMYPYDFTKENYSRLGYICEGVTTYQGDLFLLKSGVFNEEQYFKEFNQQLQKHFDNHGRFNYSVADSSYDTWLDGYEKGAPDRKVSIYTEGCLLAFVTDVKILEATKNKQGLDEVMRRLYFNYALQGKGVSEKDYQDTIENLAGCSFQNFFDDYINGTSPYESILTESLDYLGLELNHQPSKSYSEARLGLKTVRSGKSFKVAALYPGGPADTAGLSIGDEIFAVNGYACDGELDKWFNYFDDDIKTVNINRAGVIMEMPLPEVNRNFYMDYSVRKVEVPNNLQQSAYKAWIK